MATKKLACARVLAEQLLQCNKALWRLLAIVCHKNLYCDFFSARNYTERGLAYTLRHCINKSIHSSVYISEPSQ